MSCLVSFGRISAIHHYYHAPFNVYHHLQMYELTRLALAHEPHLMPAIDPSLPLKEFATALDKNQAISLESLARHELTLCLAKEWHRFPSSWLVPNEVETRFVESAFDGILPKQWDAPGDASKGLFGRATAVRPRGMNMFNRQERDRFVSFVAPSLSLSTVQSPSKFPDPVPSTFLSLSLSIGRHLEMRLPRRPRVPEPFRRRAVAARAALLARRRDVGQGLLAPVPRR